MAGVSLKYFVAEGMIKSARACEREKGEREWDCKLLHYIIEMHVSCHNPAHTRSRRNTTLCINIPDNRILYNARKVCEEHGDFHQSVGLLNCKEIYVVLQYSDSVHNYPSRTLNQWIYRLLLVIRDIMANETLYACRYDTATLNSEMTLLGIR